MQGCIQPAGEFYPPLKYVNNVALHLQDSEKADCQPNSNNVY